MGNWNNGPVAPGSTTVTMTSANTEYSYTFDGSKRNVLLQLNDSAVAWRWSWTQGVVAAGNGHYVPAGGSILQESPPASGTVIYFSSASASMTMRVSYELRA